MFILLYPVLVKHLKKNNIEPLETLLTMHLETAFKLTQHKAKHI